MHTGVDIYQFLAQLFGYSDPWKPFMVVSAFHFKSIFLYTPFSLKRNKSNIANIRTSGFYQYMIFFLCKNTYVHRYIRVDFAWGWRWVSNDALVGSLKIYNLPISYDLLQIDELCTNAWNFSISLPFKNGSAKYVWVTRDLWSFV